MDVLASGSLMQLLSFQLADDVFAIDVLKAREVLDLTAVTRVPQAPPHMLGVINLRGSVVPVVDLRARFGMQTAERTKDSCIVVLEVALANETIIVGALADSVQEVMEVRPEQIEPAPRLGTGLNTEFIRGMVGREGQFVILLNIDRIFSNEDFLLTTSEDLVSAQVN